MAITKMMHQNSAKHLKHAIDYICKPEKTQNGFWIGVQNCISPYEDFMRTKEEFHKKGGRQGYHFVISFSDADQQKVTQQMAYEIAQEFAAEYLKDYEVVFAAHNDTEHMHAHLIFNAVNILDGKKYHYADGDWARYIQPLVNRLCEKYDLSTIILDHPAQKENMAYNVWEARKQNNPIWQVYERADIDAAVEEVHRMGGNWQDFKNIMVTKGYQLRGKKRLSIKNPYRDKGIRIDQLGPGYSDEEVLARIAGTYQNMDKECELSQPVSEVEVEQKKAYPTVAAATSPRQSGYTFTKGYPVTGVRMRYAVRLYKCRRTYQYKSLNWPVRKQSLKLTRLADDYAWMVQHQANSPERVVQLYKDTREKKGSLKEERRNLYYRRKKYTRQVEKTISDLHDGRMSEETAQDRLRMLQSQLQEVEQDLVEIKHELSVVYQDIRSIERIRKNDTEMSQDRLLHREEEQYDRSGIKHDGVGCPADLHI